MRVLGRELPVNTLDELIDQLGGPERVAEVSSLGMQALRPPGGYSESPPSTVRWAWGGEDPRPGILCPAHRLAQLAEDSPPSAMNARLPVPQPSSAPTFPTHPHVPLGL